MPEHKTAIEEWKEGFGCAGCLGFVGLFFVVGLLLTWLGLSEDLAFEIAVWTTVIVAGLGVITTIVNHVTGKGPYFIKCTTCGERADTSAKICPYCKTPFF